LAKKTKYNTEMIVTALITAEHQSFNHIRQVVSWANASLSLNSNQFSHFCRAHQYDRHTDRHRDYMLCVTCTEIAHI